METNRSRVEYAVRVIEALCTLAGDDDASDETVCQVAQRRLNSLWEAEHRAQVSPHHAIQSQVFWDTVGREVSGKAVYSVLAVFGETLNPANDARRVELVIQPAKKVVNFRLLVAAKKPRRINWSHFKLHPRNCPIIEETADGVACGTCTFFMKEEHVCPRHGKIIELDNPPNESPNKKTD